jgi:hypothetical protein
MASTIGPYERERFKGIDKLQVTSRFKILEFEFLQALCFLENSVDKSLK